MHWRDIPLFIILIIFIPFISYSNELEIRQTYSRLSVMMAQRNLDGTMQFIANEFQSDKGWNFSIFRHILSELYSGYQEFYLISDIQSIEISNSGDKANVYWRGYWQGIRYPDKDSRNRFPVFGSQDISPKSDLIQIHYWIKNGDLWKLARVRTVLEDSGKSLKERIKIQMDDFIENTDRLGIEFGRNILKSVEDNGILFLTGKSPLLSIIYLREELGEREDITIYDDGIWFSDIPGLDNIDEIPIWFRSQYRDNIKLELIKNSNRPVFSIKPKYFSPSAGIKSIPWGMVYRIVPVGEIINIPEEIYASFMDLATLLPNPNKHLQRELIANYYLSLGRSYIASGNKEKAFELFLKASKIGYDVEGINYNIGMILARVYEKPIKAIEIMKKEIQYNPWVSPVYFQLAELLKNQGLNTEAIFYFERSLLFEPRNANVYQILAKLYQKENQFEFAIRNYLNFLDLAPYNQQAYYELGRIYEKQGLKEFALNKYRAYLDFPDEGNDPLRSQIIEKVKILESQLEQSEVNND